MAAGRVRTTDAEIDVALERAKFEADSPTALSAEYNRALDLVILRLEDGRRLVIPREQMQGLENGSEDQLAHIEIFAGEDIAWPELDVDHYLPHLLEGRYASDRWKQARQAQVVAA